MNNFQDKMQLSLNLEYNMVDCAEYVLVYHGIPTSINEIKIYFILLASFYELYFKYRLSTINKSLIWKHPDMFDAQKHKEADFESISAFTSAKVAHSHNWIDEKEEELIQEVFRIRNRFVHFSVCEQDEDKQTFRYLSIDMIHFEKHEILIKKLLKAIDSTLENNLIFLSMKEKNLI